MTALQRIVGIATAIAIAIFASACSHMSSCERDTAVGAAVGGVAGSVLTEGSTVGTVGGAVAGGMIGNRTGRNPC